MKAAVIERIGALCVKQVGEPRIGDYEALCEILYGATCAGTDIHVIEGKHPRKVNYPTILGHESVGRVISVGKKVRSFKVGDLVSRVGTPAAEDGEYASNWGGFAEYGVAKDHWELKKAGAPESEWAKSRVNQVIPGDIDPRVATMMITWRETCSFVRRLGVKQGDKVLVIGSGANALAIAAHSMIKDSAEVAMMGGVARRDAALRLGVRRYLDYRESDAADELNEVWPEGYDVIVDAVGKNGMLDDKMKLLADGGTAAIYGFDDYYTHGITLCNARGSFRYYNGGYDEAEAHDEVVSLIREGKLEAEAFMDVDNPYSLDDINEAYEDLRKRRVIKALIKIRN